MKVVVTGATSFLGAPTVKKLLAQGHEVIAVVRPGSRNLAHLLEMVEAVHSKSVAEATIESAAEPMIESETCMTEKTRQALQIVELDLKDIEQLVGMLESDSHADAWIHIGWDGAGSDNRTKQDVQQANVYYALAAVQTASDLGCKRFIFTGSQAEYGICHDWIREDQPCNPVSEYGIAKTDFRRQAESICKNLKMEYIHTRIFSVYGPGDHPWSLVETCLQTWQQGGTMILGECTQQWNFLYVDDTVDALICLLTAGRPGVYNIAGTDTRPLRDYIEEMYELCGSRGGFNYGERPQNAEGPADLMPDIRKICEETGWQPKTTFAEGIHETLHSMRENAAVTQSL